MVLSIAHHGASEGRGEVARLLFAATRTKFDDVRFDVSAWAAPTWTGNTTIKYGPEFKATTPHGQLPVLQVGDVKLSQSRAIERYIAANYGLFGASVLEGAQIDATGELVRELIEPFVDTFPLPSDAKAIARAKAIADAAPKLALFEKQLGANQFLVNNRLSLADISLFNLLHDLYKAADAALYAATVPQTLQAFVDRIAALPDVAAYLAARPKRPIV